MHNSNNLTQTERERLTLLYCAAFERGDIETIDKVLERATADPQLEEMIFSMSNELIDEDDREAVEEIIFDLDKDRVRNLVESQMPSNLLNQTDEEIDSPPLTVRLVLARLQEDKNVENKVRREAADAQYKLNIGDTVLPDDLSLDGVDNLLHSIGLRLSETAKKIFRRTAIFLSIGRERNAMQFAATRKQRGIKDKSKSDKERK